MKKLSKAQFGSLSITDVIEGLRKRKFSVLQSLGFTKLRAEMMPTGVICRLLVILTGLAFAVKRAPRGLKLNSAAKKRLANVLRFAAPGEFSGDFPHDDCGMVFGFNHPSLGEILRFVWLCLTEFRHRKNLFPVNLPWYEALMPVVNELEAAGICITPIITPATKDKMAKSADAETMEIINKLASGMNAHYTKLCVQFIGDENNIWVAPSATRQQTVFLSKEAYDGTEAIKPQTMGLILMSLQRADIDNCLFVSLGVIPPENGNRNLNLFKDYRIQVGQFMTMFEAIDLNKKKLKGCNGRFFEYNFLMSIASACNIAGASRLVYPREE